MQVEYVSSETIEKGMVVKTSPSIGRVVKKGTEIILYESTGSAVYLIENYLGKNYIEVKTILETKYGLNVIIEKKEPEDDKEYGEQEVIGQDLEVGTKVSSGDNITLYIPNKVLKYPDFTNGEWTVEDIKRFCDEYGVIVNFKYESRNDYKDGEIIGQSRVSDSPIVSGISITITVAKNAPVDENTDNNTNE